MSPIAEAPALEREEIKADVKEPAAPPPHEHHHAHLGGFASRAVIAMLAFFLVNVGCSFFAPVEFDRYKYPFHGWAWWVFNDLRNDKEMHNVALLGSSLTVSANAGCDANFLNVPLD